MSIVSSCCLLCYPMTAVKDVLKHAEAVGWFIPACQDPDVLTFHRRHPFEACVYDKRRGGCSSAAGGLVPGLFASIVPCSVAPVLALKEYLYGICGVGQPGAHDPCSFHAGASRRHGDNILRLPLCSRRFWFRLLEQVPAKVAGLSTAVNNGPVVRESARRPPAFDRFWHGRHRHSRRSCSPKAHCAELGQYDWLIVRACMLGVIGKFCICRRLRWRSNGVWRKVR